MHQVPATVLQLETVANGSKSFTLNSQPWWRGAAHDVISPVLLGETTCSSSSPLKQTRTSVANIGQDDGANFPNKVVQINLMPQADANCGQEQQNSQVIAIMPPTMGEYVIPPNQLELVGRSVACTTYPYTDPLYGGMLHAYGPQALANSPLVGVHPTRMALPLEVAEEPVYVNAKQYHGILRRRQIRAKAELEKKLIKARKPYLHESRHQHAMKRARGCGGRFLNTKKLDSASDSTNDKGSGASTSTNGINSSEYSDSATGSQEERHRESTSSYQQGQRFELSSYLSEKKMEEGDCTTQQRERIRLSGSQRRALEIN